MTKKSIDISDHLDKIAAAKPAILKCSHNLARRLKKGKTALTLNNPQLAKFVNTLKIVPTDAIPSHLVFLCDEKGHVLDMVNLTTRSKPKPEKPLIIH